MKKALRTLGAIICALSSIAAIACGILGMVAYYMEPKALWFAIIGTLGLFLGAFLFVSVDTPKERKTTFPEI